MSDARRTALVTGASGFVGSHLVEQLSGEGYNVRALLRNGSSSRWISESERVEIHRLSLDDRAALERVLDGVDAVFHLAAVTSAPSEADYERSNVGATRSLVEATRRTAPRAMFVLCSTQAAAGPSRAGTPISEAHTPQPISIYGRTKLAAERVVLESDLNACVVRPPTVYGPRDRDILEMFRWAARGLSPIVGRHEQRISIVHVEDLARGIAAAAKAPTGSIYFLTDGRIHTRSDLVGWIEKAVERAVRRIHIPVGLAMSMAHVYSAAARVARNKPLLTPDRIRDFCEPDWTCDDSRARAELGYQSRISIDRGMVETARWYREHRWI